LYQRISKRELKENDFIRASQASIYIESQKEN